MTDSLSGNPHRSVPGVAHSTARSLDQCAGPRPQKLRTDAKTSSDTRQAATVSKEVFSHLYGGMRPTTNAEAAALTAPPARQKESEGEEAKDDTEADSSWLAHTPSPPKIFCNDCGRSFQRERYHVHLRGCKPNQCDGPSGLIVAGNTRRGAELARCSLQQLGEAMLHVPPSPAGHPEGFDLPRDDGQLLVGLEKSGTSSNASEPVDFFSCMPEEVKLIILSYLGGDTGRLCVMGRSCKWFSRLCPHVARSLVANDHLLQGQQSTMYAERLWALLRRCPGIT